MSTEFDPPAVRFEPLRPPSRRRLITGLVVGPLLWVVALTVGALALDYTWAIALGLVVTVASLLFSFAVLGFLHLRRRRQEELYADHR